MTDSIRIPAENLPELRAKIAKLNKKAAAINCEPIELITSEPIVLREKDENGFSKGYTVVEVEVTGHAPKLAGWSFIGTLEHTEAGVVTRSVPGSEIPASFRARDKVCDHCQKLRTRKDTYVVQDEGGQTLQVGSSCLRDFLGHTSPDALARWAQALFWLERDIEHEFGGGRRGEAAYFTFDVLTLAAAAIRQHGWVSSSAVKAGLNQLATKARVADHLTIEPGQKGYKESRLDPTDADRAKAETVLGFIGTCETDGSEYEYNLTLLAGREIIQPRDLGITCSAVSFVDRKLGLLEEQRRNREEKVNEYSGSVGGKLEVEATLVWAKELGRESFSRYDFGLSLLYKFEDADGRCLSWFSSRDLELAVGTKYHLAGTVKAHKVYNERCETQLTRCKLAVAA
jgi:hypothetical protein